MVMKFRKTSVLFQVLLATMILTTGFVTVAMAGDEEICEAAIESAADDEEFYTDSTENLETTIGWAWSDLADLIYTLTNECHVPSTISQEDLDTATQLAQDAHDELTRADTYYDYAENSLEEMYGPSPGEDYLGQAQAEAAITAWSECVDYMYGTSSFDASETDHISEWLTSNIARLAAEEAIEEAEDLASSCI